MKEKTERKYLVGGKKRYTKSIDMEWVYKQIDSGRTARSVAEELGVSESTLYKRHKEYQATDIQTQTETATPTTENDFELDDVAMDFLDSLE